MEFVFFFFFFSLHFLDIVLNLSTCSLLYYGFRCIPAKVLPSYSMFSV